MSFLNPFRSTPAKGAPPGISGSSIKGTGAPLELITYDTETGQFTLGKEALQVLQSQAFRDHSRDVQLSKVEDLQVKGPIGVVAVCGRARQGKSFILNQLLGQSTGFVVAPTHRPCTKGLWMWSSPIERKNADGSKYHLVLLDTEGIDAYDQTGQYSTQIFSLAVLLSSLFVYNQMGGIDETALDRLSLVTEMTKHVRVRAGSAAGEGQSELAEFNPAFLWLLRDFYLDLEEDGRKLTPREYLETVLTSLRGEGAAVEAKNKIRESIKGLFPNRDCFALIRPMSEEKQLTKLDMIPPEQLRPQFVEDIKRLTRLIFMRAQPKRLGAQVISGSMLAALAQAYVDAINHGAVPTIATAWQGVAEAECRRAADAAEEAYNRAFDKSAVGDASSIDAEHRRCMALAHKAYDESSIGEENIKRANEHRFIERLESQFKQFRQQCLASTEAECRKQISAITARLTQIANTDTATLQQLQSELAKWEAAYKDAPGTNGPAKWRLHAEFMQGTYAGIAAGLVQRQEQAAASERRATTERLKEHERRLHQEASKAAGLEEQLKAARQEVATERTARQQAADRATALEHQLSEANASLEREVSRAQLGLSEEVKRIRASHQAEVQGLQQQLQQAGAKLVATEQQGREAASRVTELQTQAAQLQAQVTQLQTQLAAKPATQIPSGPEDMDEGYGTPEEDQNEHLTPDKMTIAQMKDWLTDRGHDDIAWELASTRAKKSRYVEEMNKVLGRT